MPEWMLWMMALVAYGFVGVCGAIWLAKITEPKEDRCPRQS